MDGSVEPSHRKTSLKKLIFISDLPAYQIQTPEEIVQENIRICALIGKIYYIHQGRGKGAIGLFIH